MYTLRFDGGSRGNPGPSGAGCVLYSPHSDVPIAQDSKFLGHASNNEAEYKALINGFVLASQFSEIKNLHVEGDSMLVIKQVTGEWRVHSPNLIPLHKLAKENLALFESITFQHIPRKNNWVADKLANDAMDANPPKLFASARVFGKINTTTLYLI